MEIRAVPYKVTKTEDYEFFQETYTETRYRIEDAVTGKVLDDAQGYGYKTRQKALAGWSYKNRDKSKDAEKAAKERVIMQWIRDHKSFVRGMEQYAFEIAKGSWGPNDKFDAKFVARMLEDAGYDDLPFTAAELLKIWSKGPKFAKWSETKKGGKH